MRAGSDRPPEQPAVKSTIVGGRPPGPGKPIGNVPHGIEVLLIEASVDPPFCDRLLKERAEAAKCVGVTLTPAEAKLLNGVPADQLRQVIAETRVSKRLRAEARRKAATVALAALGTAGLGYGSLEYAKYLQRLENERIARVGQAYAISGIVIAGLVSIDRSALERELEAFTEEESAGRGEREARELKNGEE